MKKTVTKNTLRIIDANFNRSREGLRVCEDISRFVLESPALTRGLKGIRHDISDILTSQPFSPKVLMDSRDSLKDIGRCSGLDSEARRRDFSDIFMANMERVKESLRVLEEFFKLIDRKSSAKFSELRFKAYEIEKKAVKKDIKPS